MKKLIITFLALIVSLNAFSQRHFKNASGFDAEIGAYLSASDQVQKNYLFRASYFNYNKPFSYLKYSLNYSRINLRMAGITESCVNDYTFSFDYAYSVIQLNNINSHNNDFYANLMGGCFLGVERCSNLENFKQPNAQPYIWTDFNKNYFICGIQLGIEFEYFFKENMGIVLNAQEQWNPLSKIRKWHTLGLVGVRYIY